MAIEKITKKRGVRAGAWIARVPDELAAPIDEWIAAQPERRPTRSDVVRAALKAWLKSRK